MIGNEVSLKSITPQAQHTTVDSSRSSASNCQIVRILKREMPPKDSCSCDNLSEQQIKKKNVKILTGAWNLYRDQKFEKAKGIFESVFNGKGSDEDLKSAGEGLARCYRDMENFESALQVCHSLVLQFPHDKMSRLTLAYTYKAMGRRKDARKEYVSLISEYPKDRDVLFAMARYRFEGGQYGKALKWYHKLMKWHSDFKDGWLGLCQCYQVMGRFEDSLNQYGQLLALYPNDKPLVLAAARCYSAVGRDDEALKLLINLHATFPIDKQVLLAVCRCYQDLGHFEDAFGLLDVLIGRDPGDRDVKLGLGYCYLQKRSHDKALIEFSELLVNYPNDIDVMLALANCYESMGQEEKCEKILQDLVLRHPQYISGWRNYLQILHKQQKYEKALQEWEAICEKQLHYNPSLLYEYAVIYLKKGEQDKALQYFEEITRFHPYFHQVYIGLSRCLFEKEMPQQACEAISKGTQLFPYAKELHKELVLAYFKAGDEESAASYLAKHQASFLKDFNFSDIPCRKVEMAELKQPAVSHPLVPLYDLRHPLPPEALEVISKIESEGYLAYFVEESVLRMWLGCPLSEINLTTNAPLSELYKLFPTLQESLYEKGQYKMRLNDMQVKIRKMGAAKALHSVEALYADRTGIISSPLEKCREELCSGTLTFAEDFTLIRKEPVKILHILRYAAEYGMNISLPLTYSIHQYGPLLNTCTKHQLKFELGNHLLRGAAVNNYLYLLKFGLLSAIFPGADCLTETSLVTEELAITDDKVRNNQVVSLDFLYAVFIVGISYNKLEVEYGIPTRDELYQESYRYFSIHFRDLYFEEEKWNRLINLIYSFISTRFVDSAAIVAHDTKLERGRSNSDSDILPHPILDRLNPRLPTRH